MQEILTIKGILSAKSSTLFTIASGCFLASLALIIGTHIEPVTFQEAAQKYVPIFLILTLLAMVIGGSNLYSERTVRTVEFTPYVQECWAHIAIQKDGRKTTHIVCVMHVLNLTEETIWLPQIKVSKPSTNAPYLNKMFLVKQQIGQYFGDYEIPPRGKTQCRAYIMIDADLSEKISKGGVVLKIADQHNHWHTLKLFPNVKLV